MARNSARTMVRDQESTEVGQAAPERAGRTMLKQLRPAILMTLVLTAILGVGYPLLTTAVAQGLFPSQANGSIIYVDGKPIGSALIGQYWTQDNYFNGRPSATSPAPYQANNSAGSNLGPTNAVLIQTVQQRVADLRKQNPDVPASTPIPVDLVTASASGLDPDISVAGAYFQIPRIAKARGMTQAEVQALVDVNIEGRFLGIFGEPVVNVLKLNMALDGITGQS